VLFGWLDVLKKHVADTAFDFPLLFGDVAVLLFPLLLLFFIIMKVVFIRAWYIFN
jgi:hypothetical protein